MATKIRVVLDHDGFGKLLTSQKMREYIDQQADKIAQVAGDGFETRSWIGSAGLDNVFGTQRCMASVWATTYEARYAEATNKSLSKAVGK